MKKFTILNGRQITAANNIIVLDVTDEKGTTYAKGIVRTPQQFLEDLKQSDLPLDVHPSRLAGFTVTGNIEYYKKGSTYVADENAGVTKNDAKAAFNVTRAGKVVEIKIGQRALVGDVITRTDDGFRNDFLTISTSDVTKEMSLGMTAKTVRAEMKNSFKDLFGFAKGVATEVAAPEVEEPPKSATEKEINALLSE